MSNWGRKFWLVVGTEVASTLLLAFDRLDSGGFVTISIAVIATYVVGNVAQHRYEKE